jgi:hypothetical protein
VADHAAAAPAVGHRAGIRIGLGALLMGRLAQLLLDPLEALDLGLELVELHPG